MSNVRGWAAITIALALAAALASCASNQKVRGQEVSGLDRKWSAFSYIESGDLVDLIVDIQAARDRADAPYIPLQIAVANRGLRMLTLTRESFILLDSEGNRYPCASPEELLQNYEFLDWDRQLGELRNVVHTRFAAFVEYDSDFSPTRMDTRVVRDFVELPKFGYMIDFIYFPTPSTGAKGQRLELFVDAPELDDPVFVKFEIP